MAYWMMNSAFGRNVVSRCIYNIALDDFCVLDRAFVFNYGMCKASCDVRNTGRSLFELLCVRDGLFELDYWKLNKKAHQLAGQSETQRHSSHSDSRI